MKVHVLPYSKTIFPQFRKIKLQYTVIKDSIQGTEVLEEFKQYQKCPNPQFLKSANTKLTKEFACC